MVDASKPSAKPDPALQEAAVLAEMLGFSATAEACRSAVGRITQQTTHETLQPLVGTLRETFEREVRSHPGSQIDRAWGHLSQFTAPLEKGRHFVVVTGNANPDFNPLSLWTAIVERESAPSRLSVRLKSWWNRASEETKLLNRLVFFVWIVEDLVQPIRKGLMDAYVQNVTEEKDPGWATGDEALHEFWSNAHAFSITKDDKDAPAGKKADVLLLRDSIAHANIDWLRGGRIQVRLVDFKGKRPLANGVLTTADVDAMIEGILVRYLLLLLLERLNLSVATMLPSDLKSMHKLRKWALGKGSVERLRPKGVQ